MKRTFLAVTLFLSFLSPFLHAQNNELTFAAGGGALTGGDKTLGTKAFTFSYERILPRRFGIEGSLDLFWVRHDDGFNDDFGGATLSVHYHFLEPTETGKVVPYVGAGLGKTTTDFTEIPAQKLGRVLGGIKYHLSDGWGLKVEVRDEIMKGSGYLLEPGRTINFPSVRVGIVRRFLSH